MTVNFTGTGLGTTRNAVTITGQPTGYIGAWARSGTDWAKYAQIGSTGVYSVMAFASTDYTSHAPSAWVSGDNVKLTSGTTTLSTTGTHDQQPESGDDRPRRSISPMAAPSTSTGPRTAAAWAAS